MSPRQHSKTLLVWGDNIDGKALAQAAQSSTLPFIVGHVALMPDAHWGMGATIGSVIPTQGAIIPAAVGVDIGCGMIAVETSLTASDLPDDLSDLHSRIEQVVPAGVGQGHKYQNSPGDQWLKDNQNGSVDQFSLGQKTVDQFGTLGSGNHFVEVCLDPDENVWVVLHSGSRGVGNKLAMRHIKTAKNLMKRYFVNLPDPDLAYFVEGTPEFGAYMRDLHWAQSYALANREAMMDAVLDELGAIMRADPELYLEKRRINCHHNYTAKEHHHGHDLWVTRKGAIRARVGDYGVIPGSMGTSSFIVKGLGNKASFESSAHGAGRRMSRTQARKTLSIENLKFKMRNKTWNSSMGRELLDEHPDSYKDIDQVMREQADLVEIEIELTQILNYKGC